MSYLPNLSANAQKVVKMFAFAFDSAITRDIVAAGADILSKGLTTGQIFQALFSLPGVPSGYAPNSTNQAFLRAFVSNMCAGTNLSSSYQDGLVTALTPYLGLYATRGDFAAGIMNVIDRLSTTDASLLALKNAYANRTEVGAFYAQSAAGQVFSSWTQVQAPVAAVTDDATTVALATVGALSSLYESTFMLTTGVDTLAGGYTGNLFVAVNSPTSVVFNRSDAVVGGGISNTFNVTDTATLSNAAFTFPTGMTISNIQAANFTTSGSFGSLALGTLFDLSAQSQLATLNLTANGSLGSYIKIADGTALTMTESTSAPLKIMGGSTVSVTNTLKSSSASITVTGNTGLTSVTVTGRGGAVTVDDMNGGTTSARTLTTVNVSGMAGGASTALKGSALTSVTVGAASAGAGAQTITITNATVAHTMAYVLNGAGYDTAGALAVTTLTDAVATNVTVKVTAPSNVALINKLATTVLITGTAALTLDAASSFATKLALIDASSNSGGLTMTDASASAIITGSSGNDTVTLTTGLTTTTGGTINLGPGNNTLLAGTGGSIGAGVTVNGGAGGSNVISAALVTSANAGTITNFQGLDISGYSGTFNAALMDASIGTVNLSTAATAGQVTLQNLAASVTLSNAADSATASSITLTHSGGGTSNNVAVNFASTAKTSTNTETISTLTSTGDSAISIASGGVSSGTGFGNAVTSLVETDNHLVTVTISGAKPFTLGAVHTNSGATNVGAAITVASSLVAIDGSAATGALNITAGGIENHVSGSATLTAGSSVAANAINVSYAGLIIKGGTGGDTIVNNAAGGSIIEGATAAGKVNRLTVSGSGGIINDTLSAGDDVLTLQTGGGQSAALGSGTTTVNVDSTSAITTLGNSDSVTFGTGVGTVVDGLKYVAPASLVSANANGNLLILGGTLHGNLLKLGTIANISGTLGAATNVAAAANLDQAVFIGESASANTVTWFQFGGNTYVEYSGAAAGTADDKVVQLTGVVDLTTATITTGASGSLQFA
jgi:S-layer protein